MALKADIIDLSKVSKYKNQKFNLGIRIIKSQITRNTKFQNWLGSLKIDIYESYPIKRELHYNPVLATNKYFVVPFYRLRSIQDNFQINLNNESLKQKKNGEYFMREEVWEEKEILIRRVKKQLEEYRGATLMLGTGKGKTIILSKLICDLKIQSVAIIVPNTNLQIQMINDLINNMQIERDAIGAVGGKNPDPEGRDIVVAIAKSAFNRLDANYWGRFDLVVFDECHSFCSKQNQKILLRTTNPYKLALSATPNKYWNSQIIYDCCGELINGDLYIPDFEFKTKAKLIQYTGPPQYTQNIYSDLNMINSMAMESQFAEDPHRTALIVNEIMQLIGNHDVLVMSRINALVFILYKKFGECKPDECKAGIINGSTSEEERSEIKKNCNVIFTTYSSGSDGFNVPNLTAMVFASSYVTNGKQISGRILRGKYMPKKERIYVDLIDSGTSIKKRINKRIKIWEERDCELENVSINYESIKL
ncbi:MAG: hypothetical protein CMM93_06945 [Rickettsiales bacterium]|nr:hypothetical protein [Rickettsiales bacterium]